MQTVSEQTWGCTLCGMHSCSSITAIRFIPNDPGKIINVRNADWGVVYIVPGAFRFCCQTLSGTRSSNTAGPRVFRLHLLASKGRCNLQWLPATTVGDGRSCHFSMFLTAVLLLTQILLLCWRSQCPQRVAIRTWSALAKRWHLWIYSFSLWYRTEWGLESACFFWKMGNLQGWDKILYCHPCDTTVSWWELIKPRHSLI